MFFFFEGACCSGTFGNTVSKISIFCTIVGQIISEMIPKAYFYKKNICFLYVISLGQHFMKVRQSRVERFGMLKATYTVSKENINTTLISG